MKTIRLLMISLAAICAASCSNDEIEKIAEQRTNGINVTINLSNFFSSYNFYDSQHDLTPTSYLRTFNSDGGGFIEVRSLYYDSNGTLVDSVITFSTNTNNVTHSLKLAVGNYTVISTLTFTPEQEPGNSFWSLQNKEKLSTATIEKEYKGQWALMSYAAKTVTVGAGQTAVELTPEPIGVLVYMYMQNFQYKNQSTYPTVSDNGIRNIAFYTKDYAIGYRLNPNAADKYVYRDQGQSSSWWIVDKSVPTDFDNSWTYFKSNLYTVFYFLSPNPLIAFGYTLNGASSFNSYGENTYSITNGRVYLAYWDYFQVGNPYFGIADNNHWHTYSSSVKQLKLMNNSFNPVSKKISDK